MSPRRYRPPALYMKAPFLQNVLDGMTESVKIIDDRYRLVYANSTSRDHLERSLDDLRGRPCHEAFYGFKEKCVFCNMTKVFGQGQSVTTYCTMAVKGENRDFEISIFPLKGTGQRVEYAVEVVRDITPLCKGGARPQNAGKMVSRDKSFTLVFENMAQWAEDERPVLLQGEKGTGKKSFAQALHQRSRRSEGPFRIFHCGSDASTMGGETLFGEDGAWNKAKGGTLYLDGICRLGEDTQKKLAEKLSRPADGENPRVVGATSEDLLSLVEREVLRPDFYRRFASRILRLPPLRDRKQDLPFLAQHFIETYKVLTGSPAEKLGPEAMTQLMTHAWPGNIRELETQVERACLLASGPIIAKLDVPIEAPPKTEKLDDLLGLTEKTYLVDLLTKSRGSLSDAAQLAGLSPKTLQRKMKRHGLKAEDFRNLP